MRWKYLAVLALLALVPAWAATAQDKPKDKPDKPAKPGTPAEQYKALEQEFEKAAKEAQDAARAAKTNEERQKAFEKFPQPEQYAARFLKLAQDHPKDEAAVDALVWVATNAAGSPLYDKALEVLLKDHLGSRKLEEVCVMAAEFDGPATEKLLRAALEKSPHKVVKGRACFGLAKMLRGRSEEAATEKKKDEADKLQKEAEQLFERTIKDFADVKGDEETLAEAAKTELFSLRNLGLGKVAPDIEGIDADGKKFKLSEYRGKVVVLDFWASW